MIILVEKIDHSVESTQRNIVVKKNFNSINSILLYTIFLVNDLSVYAFPKKRENNILTKFDVKLNMFVCFDVLNALLDLNKNNSYISRELYINKEL